MSTTTETPAAVAEAARLADAIDLSEIALIGLFRGPDSTRVMLRLPSGRISTIGLGDRSRAGTLIAVGDDFARFLRGGVETELRMPAS